jgi:hypothetical protein
VKAFWTTHRPQLTPYVFGRGGDEPASLRQCGGGIVAGVDVWKHLSGAVAASATEPGNLSPARCASTCRRSKTGIRSTRHEHMGICVLRLEEIDRALAAVVGGKAAHLGELSRECVCPPASA